MGDSVQEMGGSAGQGQRLYPEPNRKPLEHVMQESDGT